MKKLKKKIFYHEITSQKNYKKKKKMGHAGRGEICMTPIFFME